MPRPGGGNLGHSKHRKAFGSKYHKSAHNLIRLQKDQNSLHNRKTKIKEAHKNSMFDSMKDLLK
jgi:hypothetical protein